MSSHIVGKFDHSVYDFTNDVNYLNDLPKQHEEYDEFGQGYWKNVSLINSSGNSSDTQYKNSEITRPTDHLSYCSQIKRFIDDIFDKSNMKMVRARNLIDGLVIPHKDFIELDRSITYFRVFTPLEANDDSYHSDEGGVFNMKPGEVWFLDASIDHAAVNFSNKSRMFLCLDFIFQRKLGQRAIFSKTASILKDTNFHYKARSTFNETDKKEIISATAKLLRKETFKDQMFALSKLHFTYNVPVAACYDWLKSAAQLNGDPAIIKKSEALARYLTINRRIGERFTINSWS